jgi:hypothetical protein
MRWREKYHRSENNVFEESVRLFYSPRRMNGEGGRRN